MHTGQSGKARDGCLLQEGREQVCMRVSVGMHMYYRLLSLPISLSFAFVQPGLSLLAT